MDYPKIIVASKLTVLLMKSTKVLNSSGRVIDTASNTNSIVESLTNKSILFIDLHSFKSTLGIILAAARKVNARVYALCPDGIPTPNLRII
jgi:hypothetical protein